MDYDVVIRDIMMSGIILNTSKIIYFHNILSCMYIAVNLVTFFENIEDIGGFVGIPLNNIPIHLFLSKYQGDTNAGSTS